MKKAWLTFLWQSVHSEIKASLKPTSHTIPNQERELRLGERGRRRVHFQEEMRSREQRQHAAQDQMQVRKREGWQPVASRDEERRGGEDEVGGGLG